jgi:GMP synthase-like glutamine amidotransferase
VRALVIANADDADSGIVGERFRHHGVAFTDGLREHPGDWPDLAGRDLVLLLGSEWSVYWDRVAASVRAECALVNEAVRRGTPVFAICFGAQITAKALGGTVERARRPEVGWHRVESDRPDRIGSGPWLQWHFDTFTVPAGLSEIARSPSGPQAMVGPRLLATQFHPEATETMLSRWTSGDPEDLIRLGLDPEQIMADTRREVVASRPRAEALVDWFVDEQMGRVHDPARRPAS